MNSFLLGRPAFLPALTLMAGIALRDIAPILPWVWLSLLCVAIVAVVRLRARATLNSAIILLSLATAGLLIAQVQHFYYPAAHISSYAMDQPRLAQLEFRVDDPPRVLTAPFGQLHAAAPKQVLQASLRSVRTWSGWRPCSGKVLVQIAQPNPRLMQGQLVQVIGLLQRPAPAMNPGQLDWASYYREQGVLASVQVNHADNLRVLSQTAIGPFDWLRQRIREALAEGFSSNVQLDHALLRALTLGDNDPELNDIRDQFRRTGTSHHLAISGLHVAVLGGLVFLMCRIIRLHPKPASLIALAIVAVYGIVSLPAPPVLRSVLVSAAIVLAAWRGYGIDAVQTLSLAALALLIANPGDLFNAGFVLSFGIVFGLITLTEPLLEWFPGRDIDQEIANSLQRLGKVSVMLAWLRTTARLTLAASIVAWLISLPLIATFFEQLNPWAIVAGIVMLPFVMLALSAGFLKIALTLLLPAFAPAWAAGLLWPTSVMRWMVDELARLPGADIPISAPPIWMIAGYYALLVLAITFHNKRVGVARLVRGAALTGCAAIVLAPLRTELANLRADARDLKITLLCIGAGQTAVVEPPGQPAVLIDAGSTSVNDVMRTVLGPFLRHEGRRQIGSIFVSHADYDHISAVPETARVYDVPVIYVAPQFRSESADRPAAETMLRELDAMDKPPHLLAADQSVDLGGGVAATALWPPNDASYKANDLSLVLMIHFAGREVLFTGDIEATAEKALMIQPDKIHADVLVAPHHGSFESTTVDFVKAVEPTDIVSSNDRTPSSKQRAFDRAMKSYPVFHTDKCGAITIRITPAGQVSVETYRNTHH